MACQQHPVYRENYCTNPQKTVASRGFQAAQTLFAKPLHCGDVMPKRLDEARRRASLQAQLRFAPYQSSARASIMLQCNTVGIINDNGTNSPCGGEI